MLPAVVDFLAHAAKPIQNPEEPRSDQTDFRESAESTYNSNSVCLATLESPLESPMVRGALLPAAFDAAAADAA